MTAEAERQPWQWDEATWRPIVNRIRAGRSLKPETWKDGARAAVALSFDVDHETLTLREGERSPGKLSQGEYGSRRALPRILDLLERHRLRATFFIPAVIALLYPDDARRIAQEGHEIAIHGWIHERNSLLSYEDELSLQRRAATTLEEVTGYRPVGVRTPSWDFSPNTLRIIREMGLLYDSSLMADDDPYELLEDGSPTGVVELPVEWIRDDFVYFNMDRFSTLRPYTSPSTVLEVFQAEFDGAYEEGGLFVLTMHPHVIGHRSRIVILEQLIEYLQGYPDVWIATHEEIARFCLDEAGG